jgi:hypothetical protein
VGGPIVGWIAEWAGAPTSLAFGGAVSSLTALYVLTHLPRSVDDERTM